MCFLGPLGVLFGFYSGSMWVLVLGSIRFRCGLYVWFYACSMWVVFVFYLFLLCLARVLFRLCVGFHLASIWFQFGVRFKF